MINLLKKTLEDLYNQREEIQIKMEDCEKCIEALEPPVIQEIEAIECTYKIAPDDLTFSGAIKKLLMGSAISRVPCNSRFYDGQMRQPDLYGLYRNLKPSPIRANYEEFKNMIRGLEGGLLETELGASNTKIVSLNK